MPFTNRSAKRNITDILTIDSIVVREILPHVIPVLTSKDWQYFTISPCTQLIPKQKSSLHTQNPKNSLTLLGKEHGLSYADLGAWLDLCISLHGSFHTDGKQRCIVAEQTSSTRLIKQRAHYYFGGVPRYAIGVKDIS